MDDSYLSQPPPWQNHPSSIIGIAATATVRHQLLERHLCVLRLTPYFADIIGFMCAVETVHPLESDPVAGVG